MHTPGPWIAYKDIEWEVMPERSDGMTVASCGRIRPEAEANARLIAAAPDLLAALKEIVMWGHKSVMPDSGSPWSVDYHKIKIARAAIEKAEGK